MSGDTEEQAAPDLRPDAGEPDDERPATEQPPAGAGDELTAGQPRPPEAGEARDATDARDEEDPLIIWGNRARAVLAILALLSTVFIVVHDHLLPASTPSAWFLQRLLLVAAAACLFAVEVILTWSIVGRWAPSIGHSKVLHGLALMVLVGLLWVQSAWVTKELSAGALGSDEYDVLLVHERQADELGPLRIVDYGTWGRADFKLLEQDETDSGGPRTYVRMSLTAFGTTNDQNCGVILFFWPGADFASQYGELVFEVRHRGDEEPVLGLKAKDMAGHEMPVLLGDDHLPERKLTRQWQRAAVSFDEFPLVDWGDLENLSFYVTGKMNGTDEVVIDVGSIEFRR